MYQEHCTPERYASSSYSVISMRPPRSGLWVLVSLGVGLTVFLAYVVYSNDMAAPVATASIERSLRVLASPISTVSLPPLPMRSLTHFRHASPAITVVPQSRASNAFLGGQGPALLLRQRHESTATVQGF